jgi:hypothetical protein
MGRRTISVTAGAVQPQQGEDKFRDITGLDQPFRLVGTRLRRKDRPLSLACGSSKEKRRDSHAVAIDFVSNAIGDSLHRVLGRGVLVEGPPVAFSSCDELMNTT